MASGRENLVVELLKRRDVIVDDDAAAMRAQDQVIVARMDDQVVDGNGRQVLPARPVRSPVD